MLPIHDAQALRRGVRDERVAFGDVAAADNLGIDAHADMAEGALQAADDIEVARRRRWVDMRRRASADGGDDAQLRAAGGDLGADPVELAPGRQPLEIDIGPEADGVDRSLDDLL